MRAKKARNLRNGPFSEHSFLEILRTRCGGYGQAYNRNMTAARQTAAKCVSIKVSNRLIPNDSGWYWEGSRIDRKLASVVDTTRSLGEGSFPLKIGQLRGSRSLNPWLLLTGILLDRLTKNCQNCARALSFFSAGFCLSVDWNWASGR